MVICAIFSLGITGCIENDIPYPYIQVNFLAISAKGESSPAIIDSTKRVVQFNFPENVNLAEVKIDTFSLTPNGKLVSPDFSKTIDLTKDLTAELKLYQTYNWTLTANQTIERYFTIQNQVGSATIDVVGKRVVAYIPKTANLAAVKVNTIKLGPAEVSTMSPDLSGQTVNFSQPVSVIVKYFDTVETWTVYVNKAENEVTTDRVDAWTNVIWAYGTAEVGKTNGFEYKKMGDASWTTVPQDWITSDGGNFTARIIHASPGTTYIVRAFSGTAYGAEVEATTSGYIEIPNAMLDEWWLDGKVWNPWAKDGTSFWDTGNKGATTLGDSNSTPTSETWDGSPGYCAMLQTKFVGIGSIGKLAAGNLFAGQFMKVDGTNGILNFGREFTGRPTKLKGYCKYKTSTINYASSDWTDLKGRPDTAVVYMALTDWDAPYEIRTNPKNRQLFNKNAPEVIAYGEVQYGANIDSFTEFTVNLNYRATNRVPKYIVIVCTASKYGDYFTGGNGSVLYVSNLSLEWDY